MEAILYQLSEASERLPVSGIVPLKGKCLKENGVNNNYAEGKGQMVSKGENCKKATLVIW